MREKSLSVKILWVLCRSVAIMPYWMQYGCVANIVYLLMRYVVRYRRSLIIKQLTDSFPEKSPKEIKSICNDYYHTLAEVAAHFKSHQPKGEFVIVLAGKGLKSRAAET
ncbi:MAG: hypothetical protein II282_05865, partial [Alistipes sp.]|nr:hypothetical protein [Alistipes sp.]